MNNDNRTNLNLKCWILKMKLVTNSKFLEICTGILLLGITVALIVHVIAPNGLIH